MIGYKEWEVVCEALGTGRQVLLLRKGGIHEGRAGFSFKHDRFVLFPTKFHAQGDQVRVPCPPVEGEWEPGDPVRFHHLCEAAWARTLTDWETVRRLEEFHVWTEDLVRERFAWGEEESIHCALVRVHRLGEPWELPYEKRYGGCRTWVDLPDHDPGPLQPVLDDAAFAAVRERIEDVVGG